MNHNTSPPQSSDLGLNSPESYFFITDFLIIYCRILYAFCYLFYTIRTYSDRYVAGTVPAWMGFLWVMGQMWPDERERKTAMTRYLGCITAFLVPIWRYLSIPENWSYVANPWSIGGMIVTLLPETERESAKAKIQ
ncbi:hypothetical protein BDU57DRAFT_589927 [Ampelomyces quisqualis]|uniref:Uncharacterized protein n=1 Tax=Ampelomyces quisqualis TaxID=50730 RepID=A0A6A5QD17_AMPQU|nr:hypothetical protein BDU57DRAFT_589927 [Ampelomyces quisqualis]